MGEALREGGLYYIKGRPVDANGNLVKDAPEQPADTDPSKQPGALAQQHASPIAQLAEALAAISGGKVAAAAASAPSAKKAAPEDESELPTVDELEGHLATLGSADEVRAMQKRDKRKTAVPMYEARLAALKGE
jgi:hypothetical protein